MRTRSNQELTPEYLIRVFRGFIKHLEEGSMIPAQMITDIEMVGKDKKDSLWLSIFTLKYASLEK